MKPVLSYFYTLDNKFFDDFPDSNLKSNKNQNLIIHKTIMELRNPLKAILIHIYENNKTREEAAEIMGKSKKWLDTLIGVALVEYLKIRNQNI